MATDIKIVIRGEDQFSPSFAAVDVAMQNIGKSGERAASRLSILEGGVTRLSLTTENAGQTAATFASGMEDNFTAIAASQQSALEEIALQQETTTVELGERLLELDAEFLERRQNQREQANAQERQQQSVHLSALLNEHLAAQKRAAHDEWQILNARFKVWAGFFTDVLELAESQGKSHTALVKTLGVAQALVDTYRAVNNALASVPYPFNLAAAAVVLTRGLANVQRIRQVGIAHGGLEFVPREQTFLLDRGERVLSANQNRDLTGFLAGDSNAGRPQGTVIENLTIHILENATSGGALLELEEEEMRQLVAERIVPALDELSRQGIRPEFAERNI